MPKDVESFARRIATYKPNEDLHEIRNVKSVVYEIHDNEDRQRRIVKTFGD